PHVGAALALSLVTVVFGVLAYRKLDRLRAGVAWLLLAIGWGPDRGFDQFIAALVRLSVTVTGFVQSGRLDIYMTVTFLTISAALVGPMAWYGEWPAMPVWPADAQFHELVV